MKFHFINSIFVLAVLLSLSACNIQDKKTIIEVKDPDRHYYPIPRGQELNIQYQITNKGKNPLFIKEILTSCGCLVVGKSSLKVIPAGKTGFIYLQYNSKKNTGYVKQYITMYVNLQYAETYEMSFDVNVVPNSLSNADYEELYENEKGVKDRMKDLVDGNENELGYYTDTY